MIVTTWLIVWGIYVIVYIVWHEITYVNSGVLQVLLCVS